MANKPVALSIRLKGEVERDGVNTKTITDERGGFRIRLDKRVLKVWNRTHDHHLQVLVQDTGPLDALTAGVQLPEYPVHGKNDVGILYCAPAIPTFQGSAVGPEGDPVSLEAHLLEVLIVAKLVPGSFRFVDHGRFVVEGHRFAFFAPDQGLNEKLGESFVLSANAEGRPWVRRDAFPGEMEVVLRFEQSGQLSGSIVIDAEQNSVGHLVDFYCTDPAGIERRYGRSNFRLDGTFVVNNVPARLGRFVIRGPHSREAIVTLENTLPTLGAGPQDPRLTAIDLRTTMHVFSLRFRRRRRLPRARRVLGGSGLLRAASALQRESVNSDVLL